MTDEVESVVLLRRTPLPRPAVRYEDDSAIVVEKGAHEPTTPQGEYELGFQQTELHHGVVGRLQDQRVVTGAL